MTVGAREGIVTLTDRHFFRGLILLYRSVQESYPVPIVCYDGGMTEAQRLFSEEFMPHCEIRPVPNTEIFERLEKNFGQTWSKRGKGKEWLLWACPFFIESCELKRVLWLDTDLVILRCLEQLFGKLDAGPVFTTESFAPKDTPNSPELYELLPITRDFDPGLPLVNAGVSGWDLTRDRDLLDAYMYAVTRASEDAQIAKAISWHDQGSLIWALQKTGHEQRVLDSEQWNFCARNSAHFNKEYSEGEDVLEELRRDYHNINILHWNGASLEEKIFHNTSPSTKILYGLCSNADCETFNIRDVLGKDTNSRDRRQKTSVESKVKLVSHVSISTPTVLMDRFFEHYANLGVDEFLIILHATKNDRRLPEVQRIMSRYNVTPRYFVETYSAAQKCKRSRRLVEEECSQNDWVLYADVDEFQIYPMELRSLLEKCKKEGFCFIRGVLVDRVAESGMLVEFAENRSVWDQFPFIAKVTSSISGGWANKVCAAEGRLTIGDGGSHNLDYGYDNDRNYARTRIDPAGYSETIEIHHFKWDVTLLDRIESKLNCADGDQDSIDGLDFMNEYRNLAQHLRENGRLQLDSIRIAETRHLHYVRETNRSDPGQKSD